MNLNQHCWNHEEREAACRCPACGRSYCRECVSEHEGRLLCAACLGRITANRQPETRTLRKLAPPAMIAAGILLAWLAYWAAGAALIGLIHRMYRGAANLGCSRLSAGSTPCRDLRPSGARTHACFSADQDA